MIQFVRIDHRLLHGQVLYSWLKSIVCDTILIANDSVAVSESKKNGLRLAKPANKKLVMKSIDDSIHAIQSGLTDKYHLFIVVESVHDVYRLVKGVSGITSITLGGTLATSKSRPVFSQINLDEHDIKELKEIAESGVEIEYRLVPGDTKVNVNKRLEDMKE